MSDNPVPSAGGSYLRDDETGALTPIVAQSTDLPEAAPLDVEPETVVPSIPETPAQED